MKSLLSGLGVLCVLSMAAHGQQPAAPKPAFAIADVHESPFRRFPFSVGGHLTGDRYSLRQSTVVDLIALAYGIAPEMVQGGPTWLEMKRFDIVAKANPKTSEADLKLMLQSLLAERFALVMHKGEAPMPAYVLTAPGGKTSMKQTPEGSEQRNCLPPPTPQTAGGEPLNVISCTGFTADEVAKFLHDAASNFITEPVINQTGLDGKWDFTVRWTGASQRPKAGAEAVSIFTSVEKDMGLKLELKTAPRQVWLVDSMSDKPTPNSPAVAKELPMPPPAQFEVATVKLSQSDGKPQGRISNGQVAVSGIALRPLIYLAWDLGNGAERDMLVNAPKWLDETRFDIMAKAPMPERVPGKPAVQLDPDDFRQMLKTLLKERFNMQAHMEERPVNEYKLVAEHPKLKAADPKSRSRCKEEPFADGKDPRVANPMLTALWICHNVSMPQLGEILSRIATGYVYNPVLDATGLKGGYDFWLSWSSAALTLARPPAPPSGDQAASEPSGLLTLNEAIEKQLGLKLVREKRPIPVLVIDHIDETPTAN